jgi:hypothetical protein
MAVYTVHAPADAASGEDADRITFLRDGFHVWAMLFGPFWLVWHRLWLALLGYLVVAGGLAVTLALLGASGGVRAAVFLLLAILMGLEAASLRRWSYSRGKWRQIDFVVADNEQSAERSFFDRESADAAPRAYEAQGRFYGAPGSAPGIIGLFPEAGGSR